VAWKATHDQEASNHLAAQLNPDNAKRIDLAHHLTGGVPERVDVALERRPAGAMPVQT